MGKTPHGRRKKFLLIISFMTVKHISKAEAPAGALFQREPNHGRRILVVEDESDLRQLNAEVLIDAGYQVAVAEDGAAAWTALQLHSYDLLITDQFMPKVSGIELLKKIHAASLTLPVIMVTGILPTWEIALHPWLHSVAMLLKPHTFDELLETVKNVLHATAGARAEIASRSKWQSQPAADGLRLR
jgi:DNA-binding response OmpR family regulator